MDIDTKTSFFKNLNWTDTVSGFDIQGKKFKSKCFQSLFFNKDGKAWEFGRIVFCYDFIKNFPTKREKKKILEEYQESPEYLENDYKYNICTEKDIEERLTREFNDLYRKK